jgi:EmrB/QacA subfamily drug resistance transporter
MQPNFFKKWSPLFILSLALMIIVIDTTLLNVSLGTIIRELHTNIQAMQWVISAYSLMLAAFTITGGRLGDIFGRKKMFIIGAIFFAVGSFLASVSTNVPMLIWGEAIIEGVGAALMMPATSSLIVANYKGKDRALAFGVWGGIAAVALAIGPILGGYLTTHYSWRWGFRINVFVVLALLEGSFLLSESEDTTRKPTIDWFGIILSSTALFSFVFGIIEASRYGWWHATEIFTVGATSFPLLNNFSISILGFVWGIILFIFFVMWEFYVEHRGKMPLVSLHIFNNKQFTAGLITTGIISLGQSGVIFSITLFLQAARSLDAIHTGLSLLPMAITLFIFSPLAGYLSRKIAPKILIMIGLSINMIAILMLRASISPETTVLSVAPGLAIYGAGLGFIISQLSNLTLSAVPVEEAGEASGINGTLRQVGQTLGSAVIGAILLSVLTSTLVQNIRTSLTLPSQYKDQLTMRVVAAHSNIEFGGVQVIGASFPDPRVEVELKKASDDAMSKANRQALLVGAFVVLLGFVSASLLPNTKKIIVSADIPPRE